MENGEIIISYKPLEVKIVTGGVKPSKSEVYLLAAELQELHQFKYFSEAVVSALKSYYDYDYYEYEYDYYEYDYDYEYEYYYDYEYYYEYDYSYDYYYSYDYDYSYDYYYSYSSAEKVIALLFLSAMYSN